MGEDSEVEQKASRAPSRELLLAQHRFPGEYVLKAFGPAEEAFRFGVRSALDGISGKPRYEWRERSGTRGRRICITVTLNAERVEQVEESYEALHEVPGLLFIL